MLPDTCVFEEIAYAKAFRDTEQKGKGSMLQGGGMDVPLAVLSQQRLHVIKYFLKVPELPADVHSYNVGNQQCAHETMIGAAEALAAQRFWPSPASNDHPNVLYSVPGPNLVRYYCCCTVDIAETLLLSSLLW